MMSHVICYTFQRDDNVFITLYKQLTLLRSVDPSHQQKAIEVSTSLLKFNV